MTHPLGEAAKRKRCRGDDMEALTAGKASASDGAEKCLGYIICMDMVDCLHPKIGENDIPTFGKVGEDAGVEVSLGIDRIPADPYQVSGMQDCHRDRVSARFGKKELLDGKFSKTIVAEWMFGCLFYSGNFTAVAVHPDCSTVEQVLNTASQSCK
jgi:hypothetical protein